MTKIDEVKIAYVERNIARMVARNMQTIFNSPLPKKVYTHRKRKQKLSKYEKHFALSLTANAKFSRAEEKFSKLVQELTENERKSILNNTPLPVNVLV